MKPRRITKYQNLDKDLKKLFDQTYVDGFNGLVIDFTDPRNHETYKTVPLDTDEFYYLVRIDSLLKTNSLKEEDIEDKGAMIDAVPFDIQDVDELSEEEVIEAE